MTNLLPLTIKDVDSYANAESATTLTFTGKIVDVIKEEDGLHFYAVYEDLEDENKNRISVIEICKGEYLYDIETFLNEETLEKFVASYEAKEEETLEKFGMGEDL